MIKMSTATTIFLWSLFIIWGMCSNIFSFSLPVFVNSTGSTITYPLNSCSCTLEGQSDRCIMDEVFSSIQFFKDGNHAYVYQNVTATVQPVLGTHMKTISAFELFFEKCLLETTESSNDYLKFDTRSQCSSFKCCVQCTGCSKNRILNDRGPLILKEEMNVCNFKTSQFTILLQCGTNGSHPVAGSQFFMLRLSQFNDVCTVMESVSEAVQISITDITANQNTITRKAPTTSVITSILTSRRLTLSLQPDIKRLEFASATPMLGTEFSFTSSITEGTKQTPPMHRQLATLNVPTNSSLMIVNTRHTDIKVKPFSGASLMMPVVLVVSGAAFVVIMYGGVNCLVSKWYKAGSIAPR